MKIETVPDGLARLYELIEDIEVAMMTTRRGDGSLVSRPMATQRRAPGAHLWFVAEEGSAKLDEIVIDPNVNLAYFKRRTSEWVSVAGAARVCRDRRQIRELHAPAWKVWFPDEGDDRDGVPDDPRIVLIGVEARSAQFLRLDKPAPVILFERLSAAVRGAPPEPGRVERLGADALRAQSAPIDRSRGTDSTAS